MAIRSRINWIDWAKSTTMFLVVLGHCHIQSSYQIVSQVIYSFHIPLFFFLSGLLCPKGFSKSSLLKDCKYIIVPYFVFGTFLMITHSLLSRDFSFSFYYTNFGSLLVGMDAGIGPIWFLPALFICKQLYYIIQKCKRLTIVYIITILLSFIIPYYIAQFNINLPLFADSALFGLPFFLIGNCSFSLIENNSPRKIYILFMIAILLTLTIVLSTYNGFVSIATCSYGNHLLLYYINVLSGIAASVGICLLLNKFRNEFIITTSYGTIVTLSIHSLILFVLQYYIPKYAGFYTPYLSITEALLYSFITYIICYAIIKWGDLYCPKLLGLRGNLKTNVL